MILLKKEIFIKQYLVNTMIVNRANSLLFFFSQSDGLFAYLLYLGMT